MTLLTRILAILACTGAGVCLLTLREDRGTRSARRFTAVGFLALAALTLYSAVTLPIENFDTALLTSGIARTLQTWVAIGVILLIRQRRLLHKDGVR